MSNTLEVSKYFYDDATQDQWQQKKKSKEETKRTKKAKFNQSYETNADEYMNSYATAKDVMDNKSRKAQEEKAKAEAESEANGKVDKTSEVENNVEDIKEESSQDLEGDDLQLSGNGNLIFDDDGNEIEIDEETDNKKTKKEKIQINQSKIKSGKVLSEEEARKKQENLAKLKERLEQKINSMREKRKAIGTKAAGAPSSREQILNERKRKAELSKQQKRKHEEIEEDEEEEDNDDDDINESDGSDLEDENPVMFGNIAFSDGSQLTSNLSSMRKSADKRKQHGPSNNDIKAHLQILEKKKQKLNSMTPEEQNKQKEKDKWQRVISQAEGIKVKDNEKLLKKALKRKEKKKLRSEIEWKDRKQVVQDTVAARAKRREENLQARKNSKGMKRKNQPKLRKFTGIVDKKKSSAAHNKKKRAGFEGSVKTKSKR
ncbi:uncharacterized protein KGF55_001417 [Candida pseudojiufengensis]|uniref:uncharacterized protein n=1 Tax=Candida pseudojiufengensis TaxID=497109 RepID=UPI002224BB65|nr:uncharacterized protein KGF55_001417 [Candida pseudojiufengensis]KAI5965197.1 hypothetical protein KGF55_001417 [Candida pseudojiufengensis]